MSALKIILVVVFLSAQFAAHCQNASGLEKTTTADDFKMQERVLLIFDQDFYLAGEALNFFAMTFDAGLQIPFAFSSILYIELYDQNNTVLTAKKVLLNKGEAINTLELPRETKTGYYYIRAYTNYMKNFGPTVFFTKRLKIVNPFLPNNASVSKVPSNESATTDPDLTDPLIDNKPKARLAIAAQFNKTEAGRGDSIVLDLQAHTNDSIQYLVALHLGNALTLPSLPKHIEAALHPSSFAPQTTHAAMDEHLPYLPEFTHDIVTGTVKADNSKASTANKILYLSFVDSIAWTTRSKTNAFGRFTAALPINYQGKDLVISVVDTTDTYSIVCDDEFYPDFLKVIPEDYYPDPSLKPLIEARMINLQVEDAYADVKNTVINPERPPLRFYGYPDTEYKFSKYAGLPNLEEFITEIVYEALISKSRSQFSFKVNTESNDREDASPLIIFDGIPLLEANQLSPYISTEKLKSIRVVASRFFFGSEVYEGILDLTSNEQSFTLVDKGKNSVRTRFSPVITAPNNSPLANKRTPQYISDLYFNTINSAGGKASLKIALPQNAGTYSLSLFGFTKHGEWGYLTLPDQLIVK